MSPTTQRTARRPGVKRTARRPGVKRTAPPTAVRMTTPIQPLGAQTSNKIAILVYGEPGIGKTRGFSGASGRLGRTLIIRPPVDHTDSIRDTANIDEWVVNSWSDMDDALIYCRIEGAKKYDWVWLDSLSLWFDQGLDDIWEATIERKPDRKTFGLDRPEYGINMERTSRWVRAMVGCPDWHFGMTAHVAERESSENKQNQAVKLMPYIQGKNMPPKICGYMNVIGYYHWEEVGRTKTKTRVLSLNETDGYYAKDQFDATESGRIVNPDITKYVSGTKFAQKATTKSPTKRATAKRRVATKRR